MSAGYFAMHKVLLRWKPSVLYIALSIFAGGAIPRITADLIRRLGVSQFLWLKKSPSEKISGFSSTEIPVKRARQPAFLSRGLLIINFRLKKSVLSVDRFFEGNPYGEFFNRKQSKISGRRMAQTGIHKKTAAAETAAAGREVTGIISEILKTPC